MTKTLKNKFIFIICFVYLIIGTLTIIGFYLGTERIIKIFGTKFAVKQALLEKNKVLSVIDRESALALKMADDQILRRWCLDEKNEALKKMAFEQLESYRNVFRDKSYFMAITGSNHYYVYDVKKSKREVIRLRKENPADKWFYDALEKVDTFVLNVDYSFLIHDIKVWINAVLKDEGGKKIGVVGSGIDISDFIKEIILEKDPGISTILIDRLGVIQAHENRQVVEYNATVRDEAKKMTVFRLMEDPEEQIRLKRVLADLTSEKVEVETLLIRIENKRFLAAVTFMKGIGWYNMVLVDVRQVIGFIDFLPIIATTVLSLLFILIIISLLLNRVILRPLSTLTEASRKVADGKYDVTIPETRMDEIGQLGATFNIMTAKVLDYTQNLEGRVHERTAALQEANTALEASQKQIMASINYARMIQTSMLPGAALLQRNLKEHFIIYTPRDIVGGDFYYFRNVGGNFLLSVIDCTGHGVPGAFMTMTVNAVLNHIVDAICADDPSMILGELNRIIRKILRHDTSDLSIDTGLDIGLCYCMPRERKCIFAGAGLSIFYAQDGLITEIKGDRQRLGYKDSAISFVYKNQQISTAAEDGLYLTTDGLLDQGGGPRGFGFGRKRFVAMLEGHCLSTMQAQEAAYRAILAEYRGDKPQRDDVTFLGFRI